MNEEQPNQEESKSKWGRERWRPGVAIALLLPMAAGVAWFLLHRSASHAKEKPKTDPTVRTVLALEPFLVNLADSEGDRFLRIGIELGLAGAPAEHNRSAAEMPIARTRDTILMILTTCEADALMTPAGKAKLKNDLTQALRQRIPELNLQEVYFTEFLVQR
jgi:flagellar basal body-associated protein FliL